MYQVTESDFQWAKNYIRSKFGDESAEEYTGIALALACKTFDETKGVPFRNYAYKSMRLFTMREWKREHGNICKKTKQISDVDYDSISYDSKLPDEEIIGVVNKIDKLSGKNKWYIILRFMGMSVKETCSYLGGLTTGVNKDEISDIIYR